jgi:signal transduction histidine kinase
MKSILIALILLSISMPAFCGGPAAGEVSCDKGLDMPRVQALVKRAAEALKKDPDKVIAQINTGDRQWKDGDYYLVVMRGTTIVARGYQQQYVGVDLGTPQMQAAFPNLTALHRLIGTKGEGCVQYRWNNPAKQGEMEDKVSYGLKVDDKLWVVAGTYLLRH